MNRLKYLFAYTIIVVIALTSYACDEDLPLISSDCKSNCFEIRGVLWNASANKPEAFRRIDVDESYGGMYTPDIDYGYVVTDSNGAFNIRINKSKIGDTTNLNISLSVEEKAGYLNGSNFQNFIPEYKLNEVNNIMLYVYEETFLSYEVSSNVDSFDIHYLITIFNSKNVYNSIFKEVYANGNAINGTVSTAANLPTIIKLRYEKLDSPGTRFAYDTILPLKNQNNKVRFDLK